MAEQYQLPPAFQVPSMAEISYRAGDTQGQEQETMNNFMRQWTAATNIENANRAQSLKERYFAQQVIENDRDFKLKQQLQDANISSNYRDYLLRRDLNDVQIKNYQLQQERNAFALEQAKREQAMADEAIIRAPDLFAKFEQEFGRNAGYTPDYEYKKSQFILRNAAHPAYREVLKTLFTDFDRQHQDFTDAKIDEANGLINALILNGKYNSTMINGVPLSQFHAQVKKDIQDGNFESARAGLMAINDEIGPQLRMRDIARRGLEGQALSQVTGQPVTGGKITAEGKAEVTVGGVSSRSERAQTLNEEDLKQLDNKIEDTKAKIQTYKDELQASGDSVEREGLTRKISDLEADLAYYEDVSDQNVEAMGRKVSAPQSRRQTTEPKGGQESRVPQTVPGPSGVLAPRRGVSAPAFPAPTNAPAPAPMSGASQIAPPSASVSRPVVGYMTQEGATIGVQEGQSRLQKGEQVFPVYGQQSAEALASTEVLDFVKQLPIITDQKVLSPF